MLGEGASAATVEGDESFDFVAEADGNHEACDGALFGEEPEVPWTDVGVTSPVLAPVRFAGFPHIPPEPLATVRKRPSEYVRSGTIFFSCEADEWLLPQALRIVGENQVVYASDFPHWDHSYPGSIEEIRTRGDLTEVQKGKLLSDNARRLYGLKP
jgi:predicted TIM-barrel fold metal-dependent hydrolase